MHLLIDSELDITVLKLVTWKHNCLRVGAVLACWSNVLTAIHFHLELLPVIVVNQWVLDTAPHLHRSEIPRAEQTHHASTELQQTHRDQLLRHCPELSHLCVALIVSWSIVCVQWVWERMCCVCVCGSVRMCVCIPCSLIEGYRWRCWFSQKLNLALSGCR